MEETTFKIEYRDIAKCWVIYRYLPRANAWLIQDTRMFRSWGVRFARKRAGKGARLVLTKIDHEGTMELTYRRFV